MKIIFNREKAASAVSPLMASAVNRSTIPAVEGILIEAKAPSTVVFTTYDLEKGMRTSVEAEVKEEGYFVVNAQKFIQTLRVMESDTITFEVDSKLCATIRSGISVFKMNALDGEDFPEIPALKSQMGFYIGQSVLKKMFSKTMYAMGTVDQRQVLNGCYVHVEDNEIMIVACDSFKLAKCTRRMTIRRGNEEDSYIRYAFILPVKTVSELYKILSDDEEAMTRIYLMRKHIVFEVGNIIFFSRLIEGEYIDYDRIIMTSHKIKVEADREELVSALERASLITEEKIAGSVRSHVKLNIEDGIIKISAVSTNGSSYDEVKCNQDGDPILIAFNNRYLINSINACDTEKIKISLSSPLTSINIEPVGGDENSEEIYMLLPVRMKE